MLNKNKECKLTISPIIGSTKFELVYKTIENCNFWQTLFNMKKSLIIIILYLTFNNYLFSDTNYADFSVMILNQQNYPLSENNYPVFPDFKNKSYKIYHGQNIYTSYDSYVDKFNIPQFVKSSTPNYHYYTFDYNYDVDKYNDPIYRNIPSYSVFSIYYNDNVIDKTIFRYESQEIVTYKNKNNYVLRDNSPIFAYVDVNPIVLYSNGNINTRTTFEGCHNGYHNNHSCAGGVITLLELVDGKYIEIKSVDIDVRNYYEFGDIEIPQYDICDIGDIHMFPYIEINKPGIYKLNLLGKDTDTFTIIRKESKVPSISYYDSPSRKIINGFSRSFDLNVFVDDYSLTESIVTDNGNIMSERNQDTSSHYYHYMTLDSSGLHKIDVTANDLWNNSNHSEVIYNIDETAPDYNISYSLEASNIIGVTNLAEVTYVAKDISDAHCGSFTSYWTVNGVPQGENRSATNSFILKDVPDGESKVLVFHAKDSLGNESKPKTFNITFDRTGPTVPQPIIQGVIKEDNIEKLSISWIGGYDTNGIESDSLQIDKGDGFISVSKNSSENINIPLTEIEGKTIYIRTVSIDKPGNSTETTSIPYSVPMFIEVDDQMSSTVTVKNNDTIPNYLLELSINDNINDDFNLYEIEANVIISDSETRQYLRVLTSEDITQIKDSSKIVHTFYDYAIGGKSIYYSFRTIKNGITINESTTPPSILPILGSKPSISQDLGTYYTKTLPVFTLLEEFSSVGSDIDGNLISYDLEYAVSGSNTFTHLSHYTNTESLNVSKILGSDGKNVISQSGVYQFRVVATGKIYSNIIELKYDKDRPENPSITVANYTINDKANITFSNLVDIGGSGISKVLVWSENVLLGELSHVSIITTFPIEGYNLDLVPGRDGYTDTIRIYAITVDNAGNESVIPGTYEITADKISPSIISYSYNPDVNSVEYNWITDEATFFKVGSSNWSTIASTTHSYKKSGLTDNTADSITVYVKDYAGNISLLPINGYTIDSFDPVDKFNLSQIVEADHRYIKIDITTNADKFSRYTVSDVTINNKSNFISKTYNNGVGTYKFNYDTIQQYSFGVELSNSKQKDPDINISDSKLTITTVNYSPIFDSTPVYPLNSGYLALEGSLNWPKATDSDETDNLTYSVTISDSSGSTTADLLPFTEQQLRALLAKTPINNEKYTWSVTVSDGAGGTDTITDKTFKLDDNRPVITCVNTKHNNYTTELSFTITDNRNGIENNSGIESVVITDNGEEFTNYTISNNTYTLDLSVLDSGHHTFKVFAMDNVNNNSNDSSVITAGYVYNIQSVEIEYDKDIPVIDGELSTGLFLSSEGRYLNRNSFIILDVPVMDTLITGDVETQSGAISFFSQFSSTTEIDDNLWEKVDRLENAVIYSDTRSITVNLSDVDGSEKYLFVRIQDKAGNYSEAKMLSNPIYTDRRNPVYDSYTSSGFYLSGSSKYLDNLSTLSINPVFKINGIPLNTKNYEYILKSDGNTPLTLKNRGDLTNNNLILEEGIIYTLEVVAYNNALKTSSREIETFIYDKGVPLDGIIALLDNQPYLSGEEIELSFSATDRSSGIVNALVKIGTEEGLSDISGGVINLDGSWSRLDNSYTKEYLFKLPNHMEDGTYYIEAEFFDGVNKSCLGSGSFVVDNFSPRLTLLIPELTPLDRDNNFEWDFNYPENISGLKYRVSSDGTGEFSDIDYNSSNHIVKIDNIFEHGVEYRVDLELFDNDNNSYKTTKYIVYDSTAPVENGTDTNIWPSFSRSNLLKVKWDLSESESDIDKIEHKIEAYRESSDNSGMVWDIVMDWESITQISKEGEVTFSPTVTINGNKVPAFNQGERIRVTRMVTNSVGHQSDRVSPVIIIDDTIPDELTKINDYVNFMKTSSNTDDRPRVNWVKTQGDNESNMIYYWTFSQNILSPESIPDTDWVLGDTLKSAEKSTHISTNGETWYFILKGVNGVGLKTYGFSNGITFDDNAPEFLDVELIATGHTSNINYLTDIHKDLQVKVDATDESDIIYNSDYGMFNNSGSYTVEGLLSGSDGLFNIRTSDLSVINGTIFFRAEAVDEAGNITEEGFSDGTIYDNKPPEVLNLNGYFSNKKLCGSWDSIVGGTAIKEYHIILKKNSRTITLENNGIVKNKQIVIDTSDKSIFTDGYYSLEVEAISLSGLSSNVKSVNNIIIDNNPPVVTSIIPSVIDNMETSYVYRNLHPVIGLEEEGTSITGYKYSIGTTGDLDLLTNGWVSVEKVLNINTYSPDIDLYSFSNGYNRISNTDTIYFSFMVQDAGGNWSEIVTSNGIVLDKTLVQDIEISVPELLNRDNQIIDITIKGKDLESGIGNLRLSLYKVIDGVDTWISEVNRSGLDLGITDELDIGDFTFTKHDLVLDDATTYKIRLDINNGTRIYNEAVVYSNIFTVDLTDPEITYGSFTTYQSPEPVLPIFNTNGDKINYTVNEPGTVKFELFKDGVVTAVDKKNSTNTDTFYSFNHNFTNEEDAYGNYILKATVTDLAGNISEYTERDLNMIGIRYNEPPRIAFPELNYMTTPGQPFTIIPKNIVDNDGDTLKSYNWIFNTKSYSDKPVDILANPTVKFYHSDVTLDTTTYGMTLTVTDSNDKSATETHYVTVKNTESGNLYADEYWMEDHDVLGNVTVPDGISLQVNKNTTISFFNGSGLIINGSLGVLGGSTFTKGLDTSDYWSGIVINGVGILGEVESDSNVKIEKAVRGIALIDTGTLSLNSVTIRSNIIGVHAYNSNPVINNCIIMDNSAYGLKEDLDSTPLISTVLGSPNYTDISGNTINYYDGEETIDLGESK